MRGAILSYFSLLTLSWLTLLAFALSGTLCVTDVFWNYPAGDVPPQTWLWKQVRCSMMG